MSSNNKHKYFNREKILQQGKKKCASGMLKYN